MIFIGTVNLTRTRDEGNFLCPACGVSQGYRLRADESMADRLFHTHGTCQ